MAENLSAAERLLNGLIYTNSHYPKSVKQHEVRKINDKSQESSQSSSYTNRSLAKTELPIQCISCQLVYQRSNGHVCPKNKIKSDASSLSPKIPPLLKDEKIKKDLSVPSTSTLPEKKLSKKQLLKNSESPQPGNAPVKKNTLRKFDAESLKNVNNECDKNKSNLDPKKLSSVNDKNIKSGSLDKDESLHLSAKSQLKKKKKEEEMAALRQKNRQLEIAIRYDNVTVKKKIDVLPTPSAKKDIDLSNQLKLNNDKPTTNLSLNSSESQAENTHSVSKLSSESVGHLNGSDILVECPNDNFKENDLPAEDPNDNFKENDLPAEDPNDNFKENDLPAEDPNDNFKENDLPAEDPNDNCKENDLSEEYPNDNFKENDLPAEDPNDNCRENDLLVEYPNDNLKEKQSIDENEHVNSLPSTSKVNDLTLNLAPEKPFGRNMVTADVKSVISNVNKKTEIETKKKKPMKGTRRLEKRQDFKSDDKLEGNLGFASKAMEISEGDIKRFKHFCCEHPLCRLELHSTVSIKEHITIKHRNTTNKLIVWKCKTCLLFLLGSVHLRRAHNESVLHIINSNKNNLRNFVDPKARQKVLRISGCKTLNNIEDLLKRMHLRYPILDVTLFDASFTVAFVHDEALMYHLTVLSTKYNSYKLIAEERKGGYCLHSTMKNILSNDTVLIKHAMQLVKDARILADCQEEGVKLIQLRKDLIDAVSPRYNIKSTIPFGSRVTGLTTIKPDLDLYMDVGDMFHGYVNQSPQKQADIVKTVKRLLKANPTLFSNVKGIPKARVPIVRFVHSPTNIACDLSFLNGLSTRNTLLIKFMVDLDVRIRPLILILRQWVQLHELLTNSITSYALVMMLLSFLMEVQNPILPSVWNLQKRSEPLYIAGWNSAFTTNLDHIPQTNNNESVPVLLMKFFHYYSYFDYEHLIISPFTGSPLRRADIVKNGSARLPNSIKNKLNNIPISMFDDRRVMCIMDPFDFSHNLTRRVKQSVFPLILKLFDISWKTLAENSSFV